MSGTFPCFRLLSVQPVLLLGLSLLLSGCSEYNKALKSSDLDFKLRTAEKYYAKEQWEKAIPLYEELVALTRGTSLSEGIQFHHAKSYYGMKDYTLAGYYLGHFVRTFPTSEHAEECGFLEAYCHYKNSPQYELDQTDTRAAIDALQLFLIRYPNSSLRDSCNALVDQLRDKLELKQFTGARQYHKLRNYQAAVNSLEEFLKDWPNTRFREETLYLIMESGFLLADNSIISKRDERRERAIRSYHNFVLAYPESLRIAQAHRMAQERDIQRFSPERTSTP
ncbi:MAG: outer membrane protein assembly factor BamD [Flavobacteriales bacterium]|nr:outer membrane protein assembly factor BamD [Flavobacteriales bacterium]